LLGRLAKGDHMSRLSLNYSEPEQQRGRGRFAALGHSVLLGIGMGGLASLGLHFLGFL
jgi:hypothetical protein